MTTKEQQLISKLLQLATLLSTEEWRTIHNALSVYQCQIGSIHDTEWAQNRRAQLQQLMDKIRDNYISPTPSGNH